MRLRQTRLTNELRMSTSQTKRTFMHAAGQIEKAGGERRTTNEEGNKDELEDSYGSCQNVLLALLKFDESFIQHLTTSNRTNTLDTNALSCMCLKGLS
jgi:hypothetical protein